MVMSTRPTTTAYLRARLTTEGWNARCTDSFINREHSTAPTPLGQGASSALSVLAEEIGEVHDFHLRPGLAQTSLDLKNATRIGGHDDFGLGLQNILDFARLQTFGHFRFR